MTAAVERFPTRKLSIAIPDDIVVDQEDHKKKLTQSLRQRWDHEVRRFKEKTGYDLGTYKNGQVSKTGILSTLNKQYGSDSKDAKKRDEVYGTVEKIINGVELVGAIAAQAASVVFGPAQMCFNALDLLFSIPKAMKSFHEELSKLFREVKDYLSKFNVYDRIDQRGMLDVALVTSNNEILIAFVDLCMLAWHAVEHKTSFMLGKVFLNESPITAAVDNFGELIKKQNELTSTMTLEAVLENGALTRKILSRYTRLEESTKRIEDSVKDGNVVGKDTNVVVKGLAADSLESKNLKVDRDRILKIDKTLDLTDATVSDPLESLRLSKKLLFDEILELLKSETDFTEWDDYETPDDGKARRRLLYVGGEASTGKTKLLSALVQQIDARRKALHDKQQEALRNKVPKDDRSVYVVYYSFAAASKNRDREKKFDTPVHTALKVMAAQLARQSTRYANTLSDILDDLQKKQMTLDEIWGHLKMSEYDAPAFSTLYMFFDGLDQLKSSLPDLGKLFKMADAQKKAKDSESGKLRLRVVFTGKPEVNKKLDLEDALPMINIATINTPLIKSYVDVQLQDRTIFQDDDEASRERRNKVLDLIPSNCNGSFDVADQKLKLLETAIERDTDSDELMEDLESATFNSIADEGRKILEKLSTELSEQHRAQLREILIWTIYADRRPVLDELEGALYLQRNKTSLEPLRRKITGRFEEALELSDDDYVYPRDSIEEAIRYSDHDLSATNDKEDKAEILVNISVKNADEPSVKQFVRDLNKRISDGQFDFATQATKSKTGKELYFGPGDAELNIVLRLLRALNDDRVRRQTAALVKYACRSLPLHLEKFQTDYLLKTPIWEVTDVAKGLINFLSDPESLAHAWDSAPFDAYEWLSDSTVKAVRKILQDQDAVDDLDPIERRWAERHTDKLAKKASFYEPLLRVVAEKWLVDRHQKASARACYDFISDYLDMVSHKHNILPNPNVYQLARPDTSVSARTSPRSSQQSSPTTSRSSSPARSNSSKATSGLEAITNTEKHDFEQLPNGVVHEEPQTTESIMPESVPDSEHSVTTKESSVSAEAEEAAKLPAAMAKGDTVAPVSDRIVVENNQSFAEAGATEYERTEVVEITTKVVPNPIPNGDETPALVDHEKKRSRTQSKSSKDLLKGNFSDSSYDIELIRKYLLVAECRNVVGGLSQATLNLNDCLGVRRGQLVWQRNGDAFEDVSDTRLLSNGKILEVTLYNYATRRRNASTIQTIRLDEQISNDDGRLIFLDTADDDHDDVSDTASSYASYAPVKQRDKVKKAEEWALSLLNIKPDSFVFIRLGYTLLDARDEDAAIDYFNQATSSPPSVWKHIGLSRAYSYKENYDSAVESLLAALSIFKDGKKTDKHGIANFETDDEIQDYEALADVKGLFSCYIQLAEYYNKLEKGIEAIKMMEEALNCQPKANKCRWKLMELNCRNDRQLRAVEVFENWEARYKELEIDSPGSSILNLVSDLYTNFHHEFSPMIYLSRGTDLLQSLHKAMIQASQGEALTDADKIHLMYARGVVLAVDGGDENLEMAREAWLEACNFSQSADIGTYFPALAYASESASMVVFDRLREQFQANPTGPWNTSGMVQQLREEVKKSDIALHEGLRPYELPISYVASLGRVVGCLDKSREVLKSDMTDAIGILTDEDIYNDVTGIEVLIKTCIHYGDYNAAMSAWSLLDRLDNRTRITEQKAEAGSDCPAPVEEVVENSQPPEASSEATTAAQTATAEHDNMPPQPSNPYPSPPASDAGSAISVPAEVDKWLTEYCVVCDESMRSYQHDEFWWCKYCPEKTIFCSSCRIKLITNKLERYICNPKHDHILMKHPEIYTEAELEKDMVCVGWEWRVVEVSGELLKEEMIAKYKKEQEGRIRDQSDRRQELEKLQNEPAPNADSLDDGLTDEEIRERLKEMSQEKKEKIEDLEADISRYDEIMKNKEEDHQTELKDFDMSKRVGRHERIKQGTIIKLEDWMARLRSEWSIEVTKIEGTVQQ